MKKEPAQKGSTGKPIPVLDIDISTPFDTKKAIEGLGGDPKLYYTMLAKFEDMGLTKYMNDCAQAVEEQNF